MNQVTKLIGIAACAAGISLGGCSSAGAPNAPVRSLSRAFTGSERGLHGRAVPNHVLTWDTFDFAGQVQPDIAAPYLDYATVPVKDANAYAAAGIITVYYSDPNRSHRGTPMYTKNESTFAHDCNGKRITVGHRPVTTYQMDVRSPDLEPLWAGWINNILGGGYTYTYIFEDGANNIHNETGVPCGYTEPSWTAASNANDTALGQKIIYNGLGTLADGYGKPPPSILLNPTTSGGMMEDCYIKDSQQNPVSKTTVWQNYETTELAMISAQKLFVCRDLVAFPAQSSLAQRMYMYASFLLTYDPSSSIMSEKFSTPSNLEVFPEETLVALDPLVQSPTKIGKLKTARWTYGRQYGACYLLGVPVGSCAVAVNADVPSASHPFPWPGVYSHTLVLSGAGILDGGTADVTGPAPPSTIPGSSALIAIQ